MSDSERAAPASRGLVRATLAARVSQGVAFAQVLRSGGGENARAGRRAGATFLVRAAGAVLAFASQVLFAQWMGTFEFGIYVYVWTWVILLMGVLDFGLAAASQRFIPQYRETGQGELLRGFLHGSRWLGLGIATGVALAGALAITLARPLLHDYEVLPLYLACLALPAYGLLNVQAGIARAYSWIQLSQMPTFVIRQVILIGLMGAAFFAAFPTDAVTAVALSVASLLVIAIGQAIVLQRRITATIVPGPRRYDIRYWLTISMPMLMVEGLYLLLSYSDVLVLQIFHPPADIAVYYAAQKTLALVAFVHYAVAQTSAYKFSEYHVLGDRVALSSSLSHAIRMTFWPSLAATAAVLAAGIPLLWLFGREFVAGYPIMFVLAIGLMSRAAVGPLAVFLNMVGQQRICAMVFGLAFAVNVTLCFTLIPLFGVMGAAAATSAALLFESAALFTVVKRRLGVHGFIWGRARAAQT